MVEMLVLFVHLLGVCVALGVIVLTDLRLLARVIDYRVVIPPPSRLDRHVITTALLMLYLSGGALIAMHLQVDAGYLANPKLQAKLVLVSVLTLNAFVLHHRVFPLLERKRRVSKWRSATQWEVAATVGFSNSLWLYCAFLGIARPWNNTRPLWFVLSLAPVAWVIVTCLIRFALMLAARELPRLSTPARGQRQDWLDSLKSSFGRLAVAAEMPPRLPMPPMPPAQRTPPNLIITASVGPRFRR